MKPEHPLPPPRSTWSPSVSRPRSLLARLLPRRGAPDGDERELLGRLSRLNGPGELRAALLAMLVRPGSERERSAWQDETVGVVAADRVLRDVLALVPAARLPWFELFALRASNAPLWQRRALAQSARRVMLADGRVSARDRLWWLVLRHRLGDAPPPTLGGERENVLERLDAAHVLAIGTFSAFLARLVPQSEIDVDLDSHEATGAGERWYLAVMRRFEPSVPVPPLQSPDADATLRALRSVQALPWMLRPLLVRAWYDEASRQHDGAPLSIGAADALRLACGLLDSPLPEGLARQYIEPVRR